MRVGIYTDIHCSYTSSILPLHIDNSCYTARLKMVVDTFKWMYELFEHNNVDYIVNCGDLFDSYRLRAEEISAMAESLSYNSGIPEYHIIGNHEVMDVRRNFYATALLNNYNYIHVIDQPTKLDNGLSFLPYMPWEDARECIPLLKNRILFSHIDIRGSKVTPVHILEDGVDSDKLSSYFDLTINGHIHTAQKLSNNVFNIGATTSTSFSDDLEYEPSVCILDTNSLNITRYSNPFAIRFIRKDVSTELDLNRFQSWLDSLNFNCAVRCDTTSLLKSYVDTMCRDSSRVLAYRIQTSDMISKDPSDDSASAIEIKSDVDNEFLKFIHSDIADLKYPISAYEAVLKDMQEVKT